MVKPCRQQRVKTNTCPCLWDLNQQIFRSHKLLPASSFRLVISLVVQRSSSLAAVRTRTHTRGKGVRPGSRRAGFKPPPVGERHVETWRANRLFRVLTCPRRQLRGVMDGGSLGTVFSDVMRLVQITASLPETCNSCCGKWGGKVDDLRDSQIREAG